MTGSLRILRGDVLERLAELPDESVQCVVTSPPYWGLRDYGAEGQLGLEPTPEEHVERMVAVFREVRRVLRSDGVCWINYGDSYAGGGGYAPDAPCNQARANGEAWGDKMHPVSPREGAARKKAQPGHVPAGLKPKDLVGMPWRIAFALQADGWWLRSDIIWSKPNPMPESVTDRPTKAHEYVFLLTKSARYAYDADAVREAVERPELVDQNRNMGTIGTAQGLARGGGQGGHYCNPAGRNLRSVWHIPTHPFPEAHFATFPPRLVEPCVKAGTSEKGCCPKCGAPWGRVVEREPAHGRGSGNKDRKFDHLPAAHGVGHSIPWMPHAITTTGWRPSCSCGANTTEGDGYVPCTVLDPFLGSGTTAIVACGLGRNTIGIELNDEYADMAERRYREHFGLFARVEDTA